MKNLSNYINESSKTTGDGCVQMIQTILDEISAHSDCKYDKEKKQWVGKDKEVWTSAGQFLFDYLQELDQNSLKKIVDHFGWGKYIADVNDIHPQEVQMCVAITIQ